VKEVTESLNRGDEATDWGRLWKECADIWMGSEEYEAEFGHLFRPAPPVNLKDLEASLRGFLTLLWVAEVLLRPRKGLGAWRWWA
jgi:hypothetical protein